MLARGCRSWICGLGDMSCCILEFLIVDQVCLVEDRSASVKECKRHIICLIRKLPKYS